MVPAGAGRRRRARRAGRYLFRDGRGPDGAEPPNNWPSVFGGPAWTRVPDGQWYLHLFAPEQPDLNFANPEVVADLEDDDAVLAGPRRRRLPDRRRARHGQARRPAGHGADGRHRAARRPRPGDLRFDQDGVHAVHRRIRAVLDEYPGTMAVGEVWVSDDARLAQYLREDELQLAFNFKLLTADWTADALRDAVDPLAGHGGRDPGPGLLGAVQPRRPRHVTRYGGGQLGLRRARARRAAAAGPARRGLPLQRRRARPARRRPARRGAAGPGLGAVGPHRAGPGRLPGAGAVVGRRAPVRVLDAARDLAADARGLGGAGREAQAADPSSMQSLYRAALALRRSSPAFWGESLDWLPAPDGCLAFRRPGGLVCLVNLSGARCRCPRAGAAGQRGRRRRDAARRRGGVAAGPETTRFR